MKMDVMASADQEIDADTAELVGGEFGHNVKRVSEADIEITVKENTLIVEGRPLTEREDVDYLHRGIAGRGFERRFQLAENVQVSGAKLENGLLHVDLQHHTPEHMKPRRIEILKAAA